ncbi:MAG: endonuclease III [Syntrophomonadaceae bacterium]|nr:endonuclease III [Syntrophomonadaceae bacterium]
MNKEEQASQILNLLEELYPDAGTMLKFGSKFELLIAIVLSAQTTDEQVNKVTCELFKNYKQPTDFASMEQTHLEELIRGVGLYRNKARNIIQLSRVLCEKYACGIPDDFNELLQLPGVGRKTANVMLAVGFGKPGLGVDTHVHRVANRIGLVETNHPEKTEKALKQIIPEARWNKAHHLFIFHGRQVCKARKPNCDNCKLAKLCAQNIN